MWSATSSLRRKAGAGAPVVGDPMWTARTDAMARWLGALFCFGGALTLVALVAPNQRIQSPTLEAVVAIIALAVGAFLLTGLLDNAPPSTFALLIAAANVLVAFGVYVSGNPTSGAELFFLWITPYAYAFFSRAQAALQTALVGVFYGAVLVALVAQHPHDGPIGRLAPRWFLTVVTVIAVGVLVRVLSRSLRDADRRFHRAFADSGIGAAFLTTGLEWMEVNGALCEILQRTPEELVGHPDSEIAVPEDVAAALASVPTQENQAIEVERRYLRPDGSLVWVAVAASLVEPELGEPYVFAQFRDVTEHKSDQAALSHQAAHDPLTGLPNRAYLLERLDAALARRALGGPDVGVILLDLDQFKVVNDALGHHVGDEVLVALAPKLAAAIEDSDTLARFGGDEFVVLCEGLMGPMDALDRANRVADALSASLEVGTGRYSASASIGVAIASQPAEDAFSLLREADAAMYRAKAGGRGRIELFNQAMREEAGRRLRLGQDLRAAIGEGRLVLEYQPVIDVERGRPVALEALVRWNHPERGRLSPDEFVPLAEDAGLFAELGEWVLDTALAQYSSWRVGELGGTPARLSVNVSLVQLALPGFAQQVLDRLRASGSRRITSPSRWRSRPCSTRRRRPRPSRCCAARGSRSCSTASTRAGPRSSTSSASRSAR